MFPKPKPALTPNTYAYESEPLVKPTGFREYDARWLLGAGNQPDGGRGPRHGARHAVPRARREARGRDRPRLPQLFGVGEDGAGGGPDGGGLQGPRHRPCGHADGLFRPVRPRRAVRRHGHRLAQRQRLDRREDGRQPPAHLRSRRDHPAQGHRARRALRPARRRLLCVRREFPRPLHRRSHQPAEAQAPPQGGVRLRQRHRRRLCAAGARGGRLRGRAARLRARPYLPELQSQHRRHEDAARDARRGAGEQGRCRPGLRRRRRPLRRGRQRGRGDFRRQGRRAAGARHLGADTRARPSSPT